MKTFINKKVCKILLFLLGLLSVFLAINHKVSAAQKIVFSTWDTFEVDKCASIWLIKRFIAPEAQIKFYPHGTTITAGIPFDTPNAKFRRYATKSTYEILMEHYKLKNPRLYYIGFLVHDIEINTWGKKNYKKSTELSEAIQKIILENKGNNEKIMKKSLKYFDKLFDTSAKFAD